MASQSAEAREIGAPLLLRSADSPALLSAAPVADESCPVQRTGKIRNRFA